MKAEAGPRALGRHVCLSLQMRGAEASICKRDAQTCASRPASCLQVRDAREQAEAAAGECDAALGALSALTEQERADRTRVHVASGQAEDLRRQLVEAQLRAEHLQGDCALRLEQVARLQTCLTVGLSALTSDWHVWPLCLTRVFLPSYLAV